MKRLVLLSHQPSYDNPIAFKTGEQVKVTERTDVWQGHLWLWAIGPDGREGWIPPQSVSEQGATRRAVRDYSAQELSVSAGDWLECVTSELGWCWCINPEGLAGWVPAEKLQQAKPASTGPRDA